MVDIRRGERVRPDLSAEEMINYCLTKVEENEFSDAIDWDTEITKSCTVEELIGALVRAENESQ